MEAGAKALRQAFGGAHAKARCVVHPEVHHEWVTQWNQGERVRQAHHERGKRACGNPNWMCSLLLAHYSLLFGQHQAGNRIRERDRTLNHTVDSHLHDLGQF